MLKPGALAGKDGLDREHGRGIPVRREISQSFNPAATRAATASRSPAERTLRVYQRRRKVLRSTRGGTRTHTGSILSRLPLPIGLPGREAQILGALRLRDLGGRTVGVAL